MSYWDYDEPVWEPSEADELFDELKSKLVDAAKASLKNDMESLKRRNEYLEKRNKELEEKAQEVSRKESDLKYKEQNLRREVEKECIRIYLEDGGYYIADDIGKVLFFSEVEAKFHTCKEEHSL